MAWEVVVGIETHAQLATRSKMFSGASTAFGAPPNRNASAVDIALPGVLPVPNRAAIEHAIRFGLAVRGAINRRSIFARKNYFYPDLPKGYQISQYDIPLASGGRLDVPGGPTVRIHRAHLEEDAAKLIHVGESGRIHGAGSSVVDYNRGGTPLVEIVTEPDVRSSADAREFLQLLRTTLKQIGVSDVNMEEGSLRCDANVSVRPAGEDGYRTKTELKNMNSFRFLERGIDAEIARVQNEPVADWELEKARTSARRGFINSLGSSLQKAVLLSQNALFYDNPNRINETAANIARITAADVQRVAKTYLVQTGRTVVLTVPKPAAAPKGGRR